MQHWVGGAIASQAWYPVLRGVLVARLMVLTVGGAAIMVTCTGAVANETAVAPNVVATMGFIITDIQNANRVQQGAIRCRCVMFAMFWIGAIVLLTIFSTSTTRSI